MTLEEALAILEEKREYAISLHREEEVMALKLGIQALKRIREGRGGYTKQIVSALPGETQE